MIVGNPSQVEIITKFLDIDKTKTISKNFVILSWPSNIWKTTLVKKLWKKLLWFNYSSDFLFIKDFSDVLWKKHIIKVETWPKDIIEINWWEKFNDIWARNIISWISKTSVWWLKILLIENIDRMTNQASNSFLKTLEEVPSNVVIIWTTSNMHSILDTIKSRAFIVNFNLPNYDDVIDYLTNLYPDIKSEFISNAVAITWGRIWYAIKLLWENKNYDINLSDINNNINKFYNLSLIDWNYFEKNLILHDIYKLWLIDIFLDAILYKYISVDNYLIVDEIIDLKKNISTNISVDNAFFWFILKLEQINVKEKA